LTSFSLDAHLPTERRSHRDLLRRSQADGIVVRSMTGHASVEMTEHYSHVDIGEKRAAMASVVRLVGVQAPTTASVGDVIGDLEPTLTLRTESARH
jgi:hypothetical protein